MEPRKIIIARGIVTLLAFCGMLLVLLPLRGARAASDTDIYNYDNLQETINKQKQTEVSLLKFQLPTKDA